MFEVSVSQWALQLANGIFGSSQQELPCLEISEKPLGGIPRKADALYPC